MSTAIRSVTSHADLVAERGRLSAMTSAAKIGNGLEFVMIEDLRTLVHHERLYAFNVKAGLCLPLPYVSRSQPLANVDQTCNALLNSKNPPCKTEHETYGQRQTTLTKSLSFNNVLGHDQ